ncbi:helix-turn-helix domain-containing protein [Asanoa sp. WMMD1127]|uniref:AraC family transcriptional regulator n=1 Tax=Asanoa sp. WMMD1127 TaxID=3016107 RepID=UPI002417BC31|nr:helix-turn-helix domain-containing protein [Asanoa sp. WMMD1127]MDG4825844.1 helix-turn-helix domain-containing protein [Asanoa sp. WMMD1127]
MPGILHAGRAHQAFRFSTRPPAAALAPFVAHYWVIHWDLRGRAPHEQRVLPYPAVNMTFLPGRCRVTGVPRGRFTEVLSGVGRVFGARFRATGFRPFLGAPVATITDRSLRVEEVFGAGVPAAEILAADDAAATALLDRFLVAQAPTAPDPVAETVEAIMARAADDSTITRVDHLVDAFGIGARRMQRLFAEHVGVGPKWVIRRYRLHEAAAAASAQGDGLDVAALAARLGYADQAHLTRDFTAVVGEPPARYARAQPGQA